jgi:hypothetical protein
VYFLKNHPEKITTDRELELMPNCNRGLNILGIFNKDLALQVLSFKGNERVLKEINELLKKAITKFTNETEGDKQKGQTMGSNKRMS